MVWRSGWESRDTDSIVALYAADARHWSAPFREPGIGQAGVRAYVEASFDEEDEIRAWFAEPIVNGDQAAVSPALQLMPSKALISRRSLTWPVTKEV